jgi:hypothetical protein
MDCVEVAPLDEVLRRSEGETKRGKTGSRLCCAAGRAVLERLEKDEIGESLL